MLIAVAVAASVALPLFIRRSAPAGGFFTDSDRAAGILGAAGTGLAVLLAPHCISSHRSRAVSSRASFYCYATAVIRDEWPAMRDQRESLLVALWLERLERTADSVELETEKQSIAYGHWLTVAGERRDGRQGRLAEGAPFVPSMV